MLWLCLFNVFSMACLTPDSKETTLEFYPPKMWGLDFHFNVYNKMYVKDILEMQEYPHFTGKHFEG